MRFCSIGAVLREVLFQVAVMRLKPGGLRHLDISGNFNAVCGFLMLFCTMFIPVFLCGFAVFVPSLRPPLFRLLSDLKFYYMHVKVSCKGIDSEADLCVLIHANFILSTKKSRQC